MSGEHSRISRTVAGLVGIGLLVSACSEGNRNNKQKPSEITSVQPSPTVSARVAATFHFDCASGFKGLSISANRDHSTGETLVAYNYTPIAPTDSRAKQMFEYELIEEPGTDPGYFVEVKPVGQPFDEKITANQLRISAGFIAVSTGTAIEAVVQDLLSSPKGYAESGLQEFAASCPALFDTKQTAPLPSTSTTTA